MALRPLCVFFFVSLFFVFLSPSILPSSHPAHSCGVLSPFTSLLLSLSSSPSPPLPLLLSLSSSLSGFSSSLSSSLSRLLFLLLRLLPSFALLLLSTWLSLPFLYFFCPLLSSTSFSVLPALRPADAALLGNHLMVYVDVSSSSCPVCRLLL